MISYRNKTYRQLVHLKKLHFTIMQTFCRATADFSRATTLVHLVALLATTVKGLTSNPEYMM